MKKIKKINYASNRNKSISEVDRDKRKEDNNKLLYYLINRVRELENFRISR